MKLTKTKLHQLIKEELKLILEFERYVYRREETAAHPAGELWIKDDDGNDEPAPHLEHEYDHLEAGGRGETIFGTDDPGRYRDDGRGPGGSYGGAGRGGSYGGAAYGDSYGGADSRRRRRR